MPKYLKLEKTCSIAADCASPSYGWGGGANYVFKTEKPNNINDQTTELIVFTEKYRPYKGTYYFRTLDGFSVALLYNPFCVSTTKERAYNGAQLVADTACFVAQYDMNGNKGPNKVGYDRGFVGSFYNGFEVTTAAVLPYNKDVKYNSNGLTGSNNWQKLRNYCTNLKEKGEWKMPNRFEMGLLTLSYSYGLGYASEPAMNWATTSMLPGGYRTVDIAWKNSFSTAGYNYSSSNLGPHVRCVRADTLK